MSAKHMEKMDILGRHGQGYALHSQPPTISARTLNQAAVIALAVLFAET